MIKNIENLNKIKHLLTREFETGKSPSVQYHLFDQDGIIQSFQIGFADIAGKKSVDADTTYHAYSIAKTFTALSILQLAEKGRLDIDKPVVQYLPEFTYGAKITIKNLLNHTAGIPNPMPLSWIHLAREHATFDRNAFFKPIFDKNSNACSRPNEKFAYSNLGYIVLGQLIEKTSGKTYEEYVAENIFQKLPIGPNDLSFTIVDSHAHAIGYHKRMSLANLVLGFLMDKSKFMGKTTGLWRSFNHFYVNGTPYGGLIGKPSAFVKYIQELLKDDNALISNAHKQLLFQENKDNKGKNTGMCLSWFTGGLNENRYFAHAGGGGGYYCELRIYPDLKMGSAIFFNRSGMSDERFLDRLDFAE